MRVALSAQAVDKTVASIGAAKPGDTITLDMTGNSTLPGRVLDALAGKDVTLTLDMGGGVRWILRGSDMPKGGYGSINLGVNAKANTIPATIINNITGETKIMQLSLAHNGAFGFRLHLMLETGRENSGLWANLYYYNPATEALEYRAGSLIGADGKAALPFDRASDYAVVIDKRNLGAPVFTDTEGHWAKASIDFVAARGLLTGTTETTFAPDTAMTRGMFVTALGRLAGIDSTKYHCDKFTDVAADVYYAPYVAWAAEKGITSGVGGGLFAPDKSITREEMAVMLYKYMAYEGITPPAAGSNEPFSDSASFSPWAVDAIADMRRLGLISGVGGDRYNPQGTATRAEVAQIFLNYLNAAAEPSTK